MHGVRHWKLHTSLFPLFGLAALIPACAARSASDLTVAEILQKSLLVNAYDWNLQPAYSYREHETKSKLDSTGSPRLEQAKTYEVIMIEGSPYDRLIEIANEPLSLPQQQQEQAKLNREMQRRQNESAAERRARVSKYQSERSQEYLLLQEMGKAFNFKLTGEQQMNGFDSYVVDAEPRPDYRPPLEKAKVLAGMKGRLWIDKIGFHWVKVQAQVISPVEFGLFIAKVKPGTRFELNQAPVGGVWLPQSFTETVNASVLGLYGMRSREEERYSDYRQTAQVPPRGTGVERSVSACGPNCGLRRDGSPSLRNQPSSAASESHWR